MKKAITIIAFLPFLFAGTTGQSQRPDTISEGIDTAMVSRIAERMATTWAREKSLQIDSALRKEIVGRVDLEERPDGSVYAWIWKYQVIGRDTMYDTTIIKQIR